MAIRQHTRDVHHEYSRVFQLFLNSVPMSTGLVNKFGTSVTTKAPDAIVGAYTLALAKEGVDDGDEVNPVAKCVSNM